MLLKTKEKKILKTLLFSTFRVVLFQVVKNGFNLRTMIGLHRWLTLAVGWLVPLAVCQAKNSSNQAAPPSNATSGEEEEEEKEYQKSMEFIFEVVLLTIVGIAGIVGNSAAIALFSRLRVQLKFHRLMMMLSTYDTFYVLLSILLFALPEMSPNYKTSGAHFYVLPKALPLAQIALTGSIYSTLAITIERYLIVCHPFYTVSHQWSAKRYIVPIVTFSLMYNLPKFFELQTGINLTTSPDNTTSYEFSIEPTEMRVNSYYITIYCIWMNFIFMGLGPFILLIVLNALTLRSLIGHLQPLPSPTNFIHTPQSNTATPSTYVMTSRQSTVTTTSFVGPNMYTGAGPPSPYVYQQQQQPSSKKNEIALAKVSLTIVFIFILCHSVKWIPNIYELVRLSSEDQRKWPPWVESVTHISHFLTTFNSSVNFYIYIFKHFDLPFSSSCCKQVGRRAFGLTRKASSAPNQQGCPDSHQVEVPMLQTGTDNGAVTTLDEEQPDNFQRLHRQSLTVPQFEGLHNRLPSDTPLLNEGSKNLQNGELSTVK